MRVSVRIRVEIRVRIRARILIIRVISRVKTIMVVSVRLKFGVREMLSVAVRGKWRARGRGSGPRLS